MVRSSPALIVGRALTFIWILAISAAMGVVSLWVYQYWNTEYFTADDLRVARQNGFKIIQLDVPLDVLRKRNQARVLKEKRDDWGKWLEGMVQYQRIIRNKGLVDEVVSGNQSVKETAKELLELINE